MFKKLFGETEEEQFELLKKQLLITLACFAVGGIIAIAIPPLGMVIGMVIPCYFIWGKDAMKAMSGAATFGAIFGGYRNIVIGVLVFLAYLFLGYIAAFVCLVLGICRFIYLLTERIREKQKQEEIQ